MKTVSPSSVILERTNRKLQSAVWLWLIAELLQTLCCTPPAMRASRRVGSIVVNPMILNTARPADVGMYRNQALKQLQSGSVYVIIIHSDN